jgi:endonuclease-3
MVRAQTSPRRRMTPAQLRRESLRARRARTAEILKLLSEAYPGARTALLHRNPFELLVATVLSAQTTDVRVNLVTPALFRRFPNPRLLAAASLEVLEELVHSTGFYRHKARALKALGEALSERYGGRVPESMEQLTTLPGVGRKTANVVLGSAFGLQEGIVVDTHVQRLARRLGLTSETMPEKIERDLMELVPREAWTLWSHLLILHGRQICLARTPRCPQCAVMELCPSAEIEDSPLRSVRKERG